MLKMPDAPVPRALFPVTACLLIAGCGGRAAAPQPAGDAVTHAERVDGRGKAAPQNRGEAVGTQEEALLAGLAPGDVAEEDLDNDVPPRQGPEAPDPPLRHILQRGQTLYSLARLYGVDLQELIRINGIADPNKVSAGRPILIPGGSAPPAMPPGPGAPDGREARGERKGRGARDDGGARVARGAHLAWPLHGAITASYGRRGKRAHHTGLDIDGNRGDPIQAAASGVVASACTDGEYGRVVIVDHGDGLSTLYAHASRILVKTGDRVRAGERIAEVGGSGNARGTHLHFEVRRDGRPIDPLPYLRSPSVLTAATH